jgi:hypothetical protein
VVVDGLPAHETKLVKDYVLSNRDRQHARAAVGSRWHVCAGEGAATMSAVDLDPFGFAGQPEGDAELVRAERRLRDILPLWEREPLSNEEADALSTAMHEQIEGINNTAPITLFGAAIK